MDYKITVAYISYYVTHYNIRVIFPKDLTQLIVTCEIIHFVVSFKFAVDI